MPAFSSCDFHEHFHSKPNGLAVWKLPVWTSPPDSILGVAWNVLLAAHGWMRRANQTEDANCIPGDVATGFSGGRRRPGRVDLLCSRRNESELRGCDRIWRSGCRRFLPAMRRARRAEQNRRAKQVAARLADVVFDLASVRHGRPANPVARAAHFALASTAISRHKTPVRLLCVVLLLALCGCASDKPKRQFAGRCDHCAKSVVFSPYRVVVNGSASFTNRLRTDQSLLFKCPSCKCKNQIYHEEWKIVSKAIPLPPSLPTP